MANTEAQIGIYEGTGFFMFMTPDGTEEIHRYGRSEILEIFSERERTELATNGSTMKSGGIWIDMIAASRDHFQNA